MRLFDTSEILLTPLRAASEGGSSSESEHVRLALTPEASKPAYPPHHPPSHRRDPHVHTPPHSLTHTHTHRTS